MDHIAHTFNSTIPNVPSPGAGELYCDPMSWFNIVSTTAGSLAFISSMIAQFPQLIETYRDKTVEGISELLILGWLGGDITSVIGSILTKQLPFQIILAIYFLANDIIIFGQYCYYGLYHKNKLATPGHQHLEPVKSTQSVTHRSSSNNSNNGNKGFLAVILAFFTRSSSAMPLPLLAQSIGVLSGVSSLSSSSSSRAQTFGTVCSWAGGLFYFCSRIPQLMKNYHRKSTDGVSPYLFYCTIFHNVTYGTSIFTSCQYVNNPQKWEFVKNELPFLLGSVGTLFFDMIYLYQHWVLYSDDLTLRKQLSRSQLSYEEIDDLSATETSPLLTTRNN